jgi:hypothetical protein
VRGDVSELGSGARLHRAAQLFSLAPRHHTSRRARASQRSQRSQLATFTSAEVTPSRLGQAVDLIP